jgi:hypothetical protein
MKQYVRDERTGKFKIVEKDAGIKKITEGNEEAQKWVQSVMEGQKLKELEARVKILEATFAAKKK